MLAALAVYSQDNKAQVAAVAALRGRGAADYGDRLISLMHNPMRVEERQVPIPGGAPGRVLFVEGDSANYQFFFSRAGGTDVAISGRVFPAPTQRFRDRNGPAVQREPGRDGQSGP